MPFLAAKHCQNLWAATIGLNRKTAQFFASPASGFAARVSIVTMSIAIIAYLLSSQNFYIKQHLFWAQSTVYCALQDSAGTDVRALSL